MLKSYADEHVPAPLVKALLQRGMDIVTVQERGRKSIGDSDLLAEVLCDERVLLTSDKDFLPWLPNISSGANPSLRYSSGRNNDAASVSS